MIEEIQTQLSKLPEGATAEIHISQGKAAIIVKTDLAHGLAAENISDANLITEVTYLVGETIKGFQRKT